MRSLVCYVSVHHGNTKKIAGAMAQAIGAGWLHQRISQQKTSTDTIWSVLAPGSTSQSTTRAFWMQQIPSLPPQVRRHSSSRLPDSRQESSCSFLFHRALKTKLREKGFIITGDFSCRGLDTYKIFGTFGGMNKGHSDNNDLNRAQTFAKKMTGL